MSQVDLDRLCIDTIRTLAIDAVEKANSGHPGAPMGLAPTAYCLWQRFLRYDPAAPRWPNRDRFVLSAGHASMLLYALLHLAGVRAVDAAGRSLAEPAVSMEDIKRFRQLGSRTPGHPESHLTTGVETTTGPLGQGAGNSVGMAIAGMWLAAHFNRPGFTIFDFDVYAVCSDGDMMEGVASEAASLAGHLALPNLCWIYDNNRVTLDGPAGWCLSEDVAARFAGYGWKVARVFDANDLGMLTGGFKVFRDGRDRPTLVIVHSHIGYGAPNKQDTAAAHGEPLGEEEAELAKESYGWPPDARFRVPDGVYEEFRNGVGARGAQAHAAWQKQFEAYAARFPELAAEFAALDAGRLPDGWEHGLPVFPADSKGMATRDSSGKTLTALAKNIPWMVGGSADLAHSNKTNLTFAGASDIEAGAFGGRNLHFGVREHAMGAIVNGMTITKLRAFSGTFFNFSDYMRPAMRLGALMGIPALYIFTHDSIGVGEDGPTHQPVEQLAGLRAMPNMLVVRPADANEVVEAYKAILQHAGGPASLVLTRQAVPTLDRTKYAAASGLARGAYVLADAPGGPPEVILMASGSEVALCVSAFEQLSAAGVRARVVSMPCWELFEVQDAAYHETVLPAAVTARVAVEMASPLGWERYLGARGVMLGMRSFGASAPLKDLLKHFGFEAGAVVKAAQQLLAR